MKGQNPLAILVGIGVLFIVLGGLILAFTITSPNAISIGLIIVGVLMIGIAGKFGG